MEDYLLRLIRRDDLSFLPLQRALVLQHVTAGGGGGGGGVGGGMGGGMGSLASRVYGLGLGAGGGHGDLHRGARPMYGVPPGAPAASAAAAAHAAHAAGLHHHAAAAAPPPFGGPSGASVPPPVGGVSVRSSGAESYVHGMAPHHPLSYNAGAVAGGGIVGEFGPEASVMSSAAGTSVAASLGEPFTPYHHGQDMWMR